MNHQHKHDHCKHEHMKFCAHCDKPHCLDCGQEWNQSNWLYAYSVGAGAGIQYTPTVYGNTITPQPTGTMPVITCSHLS